MRICLTFATQFETNTNSAASLAVQSADFGDLNAVVQATIIAICSIDCARGLELALVMLVRCRIPQPQPSLHS